MTVGKIAESAPVDIAGFCAEGVIEFGWPVCKGSAPDTQVKAYDGGGKVVGFSAYDPVKGSGPDLLTGAVVRRYADGDTMGVMRKGIMWVLAGATVVADMQAAIIDTIAADPAHTPTVAEAGSGTDPCFPTESDVRFGFTLRGPWGESLMSPASVTTDCSGITNYLNVTVVGQTAVPVGTTHLQMYASVDGGTVWVQLTGLNVAYASLTNGATHVVAVNGTTDAVNSTNPPATSPAYLIVGTLIPDTDTRDKTVLGGTRIAKGGAAGAEVKVEINLPA